MKVRPLRTPSSSVAPSTGLAALLLLLPLVPACTAGARDDGFDFATESNGPVTAVPGSSTADDTVGSEGSGSTTAASEDGGDTGTSDGADSSSGDDLPIEPCTAVDILFVVDDSEPMLEEQLRLQAAALAFVQQVTASIPTLMSDLHIGVITTDDELLVQATDAAVCGPYEGGNNWMVSSSTTLQTELECALAVGVGGSPNERPMDMLRGALSDANLMPGGFHNGFLREQALLVVVLVTNEEDELERDTSWGSMGEPAEWVETLASRKGGYEKDVVVLSLVGIEQPNACEGPWDGTVGAQVAPRLIEFTEAFPQGAVGDVCALEYGTFLQGVVPGVTAACANFTPP